MLQASDFSGEVVRGRQDLYERLDSFNGGPEAHLKGAFSEVADWPLGAIHAVLLPLGTVLTYGTAPDENGVQENSSGLIYDVWNPALGLAPVSHTTLDILSPTNIFCSAQVVLPGSGNVLIAGGDQNYLPEGLVNESIAHVNLFNPLSNAMDLMPQSMAYPRWYPTLTTLANGEQLVQGGRLAQGLATDETGVVIPEIYNIDTGWRSLEGATAPELWGYGWYYPRAFVTPSGKVLSFKDYRKEIFLIDPEGEGGVEKVLRHDLILSAQDMPALMYRPGKIMTIYDQHAYLVDVSESDTPVITETQALIDQRHDSDATLLFDGSVLLSGGSREDQVLEQAVYPVDIWSPATGLWARGASAAMERFYHSSALLLTNGAVLTAGGGPPGPVANINAEIYYPPYLFKKDGSGELADRPVVSRMGAPVYGERFSVEISGERLISQVAAVRTGSVTHSFDQAQRYIPLSFEQLGNQLTIASPANNNIAPPGQYMLVLTDDTGVPSLGEIFQLTYQPSSTLLSHQPGDQFGSDTVTLSWQEVPGASRYVVRVGTEKGGRDLGVFSSATETERSFRRLPYDGRTVHVKLSVRFNGQWASTYHEFQAVQWPEFNIDSHQAGDSLASDQVLFSWPEIPGATRYRLWFGSSEGGRDIRTAATAGDTTEKLLRRLPSDGREMYVTPMFQTADRYWRKGSSVLLNTVNWPVLKIDSQQAGEQLSSDFARFSWPEMPSSQRYYIRIGSAPLGRDLGRRSTQEAEATIRRLPTDGRDMHVTVQFKGAGGYWRLGPSVVIQAANLPEFALLSPPERLSSNTRFEWQDMPGATAYQLKFGSQKNAYDIARIQQSTAGAVVVDGLPVGQDIHLRLMYSDGNYWRSAYYFWPALEAKLEQ